MFLDEVTITAQGGDGGRGSVSWRREKYVPKGGPDGGDGGRGGDVSLIANENTDTLSAFASQKCFTAGDGTMGGGKKCHGRDGKNLVLKVPPGTLVYEELGPGTSPRLLADLEKSGDHVLIAHGGRGGYGNAHFVSSIRQRPDFAELGEPGEKRQCTLELKLIADVGIIGLPNCGKSTLIAAMSAARPRIANYPFTTLVPNLGVVILKEQPTFAQPPHELRPAGKASAGKSYIVCDIPGLMEGASTGKGLGDRFLRHIERCGILLHLLDCTRTDTLVEDYHVVRKELAAYSPTLAGKKELVVLNKTDLIPGREERERIENRLRKEGIPVSASISAALHTGTEELKKKLLPLVLAERQKRAKDLGPGIQDLENLPILRPHETSPRASAYRIHQEGTTVHIRGKRIEQIVTMTDTKNASAIRRLLQILDRIGLIAALRSLKLSPEHQIFIGKTRIDPLLNTSIYEKPENV